MKDRGRRDDPVERFLTSVLVEAPLILYVLIGGLGAALISDDFDSLRLPLMAYFGIPAAVLFYSSRVLYPEWQRRWPRAFRAAIAVLFIVYTTGTVPAFNALTAKPQLEKRTVERGTGIAVRDMRRGGFGMLFRTRW